MESEEKVVFFSDFKKEAFKKKVKDTVDKAKKKACSGIKWCMDHPAEALGFAAAGSAVITKTARYRAVKTEERRRETEFYDPRTGMYAKSKRPLTSREKLKAEERYKNGENWSHILSDMRLLK